MNYYTLSPTPKKSRHSLLITSIVVAILLAVIWLLWSFRPQDQDVVMASPGTPGVASLSEVAQASTPTPTQTAVLLPPATLSSPGTTPAGSGGGVLIIPPSSTPTDTPTSTPTTTPTNTPFVPVQTPTVPRLVPPAALATATPTPASLTPALTPETSPTAASPVPGVGTSAVEIIVPTRAPTATPSSTATPTPTSTPTSTVTPTPTVTFTPTSTPTATPNPLGEPAVVLDVIDPVTIVVQIDGQERRVRYLLLLPPPLENPAYAAALEYNRGLVDDKAIFLLADPLAPDVDAEGRLLRYVHLPDGTLVNLIMMQQGYATTDPSIPDAQREGDLYLAKVQAANSQRGMWAYISPLSEGVTVIPAIPSSGEPEANIVPVANVDALLYAGPGESYDVVGRVVARQRLVVIAVDPTGLWLQLADGSWISRSFVDNVVATYPVATANVPTPIPPAPIYFATFTPTPVGVELISVSAPADGTPRGKVPIPGQPVPPVVTPLPPPVLTPTATMNGGARFSCPNGCLAPPDPSCIIKGNVTNTGDRVYHTFASPTYNLVVVLPDQGDRYFCFEAEAIAAGFRSALDLPPATPVLPPTPVGYTPEEAAYLTEAAAIVTLYGQFAPVLDNQVAAVSESPLLIFNETWIVQTATARDSVNGANQRVYALSAPPRFASLHLELVQVADAYARATESLTVGVENVDIPRLLQAQQELLAGNAALARVRQSLLNLQVPLPEPSAAPETAPPDTAIVPSGFSVEEMAYLNQVSEISANYASSFDVLEAQLRLTGENPNLIYDEGWIANITAALASVNVQNERIRQLVAPARFAAAHAELLLVADSYTRAIDNLTLGISNREVDRLLQAQQELLAGSEAFMRAQQLLINLQVLPPAPTATPTSPPPAAAPVPPPVRSDCDPNYAGACIPLTSSDLNCGDIPDRNFFVVGSDPHGFDRDKDGIACESDD